MEEDLRGNSMVRLITSPSLPLTKSCQRTSCQFEHPLEISTSNIELGDRYILVGDQKIRVLPHYRHRRGRRRGEGRRSFVSKDKSFCSQETDEDLYVDSMTGLISVSRSCRDGNWESEKACDGRESLSTESRYADMLDGYERESNVTPTRFTSTSNSGYHNAAMTNSTPSHLENVSPRVCYAAEAGCDIRSSSNFKCRRDGNNVIDNKYLDWSRKYSMTDPNFSSSINDDRQKTRLKSDHKFSNQNNTGKILDNNSIKSFPPQDNKSVIIEPINLKPSATEVHDVIGKPSRRAKCANCCKKFVAFLFSTVGSCCLLVAYTILGGFVFVELEADHEVQMKDDMKNTRREFVDRLWNMTEKLNVLYPHNWSIMADNILENYTRQVFQASKKKGWDGTDKELELQWSLAGALLYSITVVTTIGYGHIAPKTKSGKVVTIIYAIFGIPLTLFTITNLGSIMATSFRFIYKYLCCGICCLCCASHCPQGCCCCGPKSKQRRPSRAVRSQSAATLSRNRYSVSANKRNHRRSMSAALDGRPLVDGISASDSEPTTLGRCGSLKEYRLDLEDGIDFLNQPKSFKQRLTSVVRRYNSQDSEGKISVPIYVSLLLMLGYIGLGALVFRLREDWTTLECLYFCFITLSTIGFGDYVPGTSIDKIGSQEMMVVCALYLVFGLAFIAMCFNLIQEEARNKLRRLGRRLGLLSDTE